MNEAIACKLVIPTLEETLVPASGELSNAHLLMSPNESGATGLYEGVY